MTLAERISRLRSKLASARSARSRKSPQTDAKAARPGRRTASGDARRASDLIASVVLELGKLVREMLAIPAQLFMAVAEIAGSSVLVVWRRLVWPLALALWALAGALYRLALRHVTPARAAIALALVAAVCLAASQWVDYRGISVGSDAYTGELEVVAPAPEVERARAGEAHAWLMVPLAVVALAVVAVAVAGRPRIARLLIVVGLVAIAIAVLIDAPKGLDEGTAAVAYEGASARLLEGFWLQIASAATLIACGLLLPRYLRGVPVAAPVAPRAWPGRLRRLGERAGKGLRDRGKRLREQGKGRRPPGSRDRPTRPKRGAQGASP